MNGPRSFNSLLLEALNEFAEKGFASEVDLQEWLLKLAWALDVELPNDAETREALATTLQAIFNREIGTGLTKKVPGVSRYTLDRVAPELRAELDRRIYAGVDLIKLNKQAATQKTLQRFSGWVTSNRSKPTKREMRQIAKDITKPTAELRFQRRRVAIDQGHKLNAAVAHVVAEQHGAIAAIWHDRGARDHGYDARPEHLAREGKLFFIRDSWAVQDGLVKRGGPYTDEIEQPAELVYCSCYYEYVTSPRQLPEDALTAKGREWLEGGQVLERADLVRHDSGYTIKMPGKLEPGTDEAFEYAFGGKVPNADDQHFYHVTFAKHEPDIVKHGLRPSGSGDHTYEMSDKSKVYLAPNRESVLFWGSKGQENARDNHYPVTEPRPILLRVARDKVPDAVENRKWANPATGRGLEHSVQRTIAPEHIEKYDPHNRAWSWIKSQRHDAALPSEVRNALFAQGLDPDRFHENAVRIKTALDLKHVDDDYWEENVAAVQEAMRDYPMIHATSIDNIQRIAAFGLSPAHGSGKGLEFDRETGLDLVVYMRQGQAGGGGHGAVGVMIDPSRLDKDRFLVTKLGLMTLKANEEELLREPGYNVDLLNEELEPFRESTIDFDSLPEVQSRLLVDGYMRDHRMEWGLLDPAKVVENDHGVMEVKYVGHIPPGAITAYFASADLAGQLRDVVPDYKLIVYEGSDLHALSRAYREHYARHDADIDESKGQWVTMHGTHVFIENGKITKGPAEFVGKAPDEIEGGKEVMAAHRRAAARAHKQPAATLPPDAKAEPHFEEGDYMFQRRVAHEEEMQIGVGKHVKGTVRLTTMATQYKTAFTRGLSTAMEAFPELKEKVVAYGSANEVDYEIEETGHRESVDDFVGITEFREDGKTAIFLSPKELAYLDRNELNLNSGYSASARYATSKADFIRRVTIHEAGHVLQETADADFQEAIVNEYRHEQQTLFYKAALEGSKKWPSRYATVNEHEFFAEAFQLYTTGHGDDLPQSLREILDKKLGSKQIKMDAASSRSVESIACNPFAGTSVIRWSDGTTSEDSVDDERHDSVTHDHPDDAARDVHRDPTRAQIEAGNYAMGHVKIHGLDVTLENPKGGTRSGIGADGQPWSVRMPAHYGYIRRTVGADDEQLDCYVGASPYSEKVWVIEQRDLGTHKFDEYKVMLGFDTQAEALSVYQRGFSDGKGMERCARVIPLSITEFKDEFKIIATPDWRPDAKLDPKGQWVTLHGTHVFIVNGVITKGPKMMVGKKPSEIRERDKEVSQGVRAGMEGVQHAGWTVRVTDGYVPKKGFAVAGGHDSERIVPYTGHSDRQKLRAAMKKYLEDYYDRLHEPNVYFGGWVEGGQVYLDTPSVIDSQDEALELGRKRKEIAIFDLSSIGTDRDGTIYTMSDHERPKDDEPTPKSDAAKPKRVRFLVDPSKSSLDEMVDAVHEAWEQSNGERKSA